MSSDEVDEFLAHYGVLGMKWGKRKGQTVEVAPPSADAANARAYKAKGVHALSNDELRQLNQRTQLEMDYARLNPGGYKKAKAVVTEVMAVTATARAMYAFVNSPMGKAAQEKVKEFLKS